MKKNVKGFISLFAGLGAIALTAAALFVPTIPIAGTSLSFYGTVNIAIASGAVVLGIAAIIFGVMSRRDADKTGPRKAGVIAGVFAMLIAVAASGVCALSDTVAEYANGKPGNVIAQLDESGRKPIDDALAKLRAEYPPVKAAK